jgi:hypothetical protein
MRQLARSLGVQAFGSLDLIRVLEDPRGVTSAITSLRDNWVVDLPIEEPWYELAAHFEWRIDSPFATAISRPAPWRKINDAFVEFQSLIRRRPENMSPENIVIWTHLAANGLAGAAQPSARPKAVSALLAWVIFVADPFFAAARDGVTVTDNTALPDEAGRVTELIIGAADMIRDQHYDGVDAVAPLIDIVCRSLVATLGPESTSRTIAGLVDRLDDEVGTRVFTAYIQSVGK